MSKKLKPCPFCGGEAELIATIRNWSGEPKMMYLVKCKNRCCNQFPHDTKEEAREAWNRRAGGANDT